jgi:hypothetical protein
VFPGNSARPPTLQTTFERLGLSKPLEWVTANIVDQVIYFPDSISISV